MTCFHQKSTRRMVLLSRWQINFNSKFIEIQNNCEFSCWYNGQKGQFRHQNSANKNWERGGRRRLLTFNETLSDTLFLGRIVQFSKQLNYKSQFITRNRNLSGYNDADTDSLLSVKCKSFKYSIFSLAWNGHSSNVWFLFTCVYGRHLPFGAV